MVLSPDMSSSKPQLPTSLIAVLRLHSKLRTSSAPGSVTVGSYSLRDLALRDIVVTSPEHLGSHVVIKAKSVSLHPSWDVFKGAAPSLQHISPKNLLPGCETLLSVPVVHHVPRWRGPAQACCQVAKRRRFGWSCREALECGGRSPLGEWFDG